MSKHINATIGIAYLEGRLDAAQQAKIERHLADCATCQTELLERQTAHDLLLAAGQDFSPEPVRIPSWSTVKARQPARPFWQIVFHNGSQLALAGIAVLLAVVFIWQLRPQVPLIDVAPTITVTGMPVVEPTPLATPLPNPSVIIIPGVDQTPTPGETAEPTPDAVENRLPIMGDDISAVAINQEGRAAFVADGLLFVETSANSATFDIIAEQAQIRPPAWSANGQELLFFAQNDDSELPILVLWTAETGRLTPLSELIDRPLPNVSFRDVRWAKDGRKILLPAFGKLEATREWDSSVWLVDLDTGHMTLVVEAIALKNVEWLTNDVFVMTLDCGVDCTIMMAYDTAKTLLWKAYQDRAEFEAASDLFVVQPSERRILHLNTFDQPQRVDALNTSTGAITSILELADGVYFANHQPYLAANGRILFYQVVNAEGQPTIQTLNLEDLTTGTLTLRHEQFAFGSGAWDSAGNYFIYSVTDPTIGAAYVYLWQPSNNATTLIQAVAGEARFQNFNWTRDGRYVYYNLGNEALWQYDVVAGELRAIAGQ